MRLRGGRMIVNPVRYASGKTAKPVTVTMTVSGNTDFYYFNQDGEVTKTNDFGTVQINTLAGSMIVTYGYTPRDVINATRIETVVSGDCYIYLANA